MRNKRNPLGRRSARLLWSSGFGLFCGVIQSLGNLNAYMFGRPPVLSDYVPILCVIAASLLTGVALRHRPRRQKLAAGLLIGAGVDILLFGLCFVGPNYSA